MRRRPILVLVDDRGHNGARLDDPAKHWKFRLADLDVDGIAMPYDGRTTFRPHGHFGYPTIADGLLRTSAPHLGRFLAMFAGRGAAGMIGRKLTERLCTARPLGRRRGRDFVAAADRMIQKNIRVNNEFYIAPTYNEMIADGKTLLPYPIAEMKGLGTPEDLERFLKDHHEKRRAS